MKTFKQELYFPLTTTFRTVVRKRRRLCLREKQNFTQSASESLTRFSFVPWWKNRSFFRKQIFVSTDINVGKSIVSRLGPSRNTKHDPILFLRARHHLFKELSSAASTSLLLQPPRIGQVGGRVGELEHYARGHSTSVSPQRYDEHAYDPILFYGPVQRAQVCACSCNPGSGASKGDDVSG